MYASSALLDIGLSLGSTLLTVAISMQRVFHEYFLSARILHVKFSK
jgi:hypothetical protein